MPSYSPFPTEEDLYGLLKNDEKLIATLSPQAVDTYAHTFIQ